MLKTRRSPRRRGSAHMVGAKLAQQAFALSLAAPQVVAHRVGRMAVSTGSLADQAEFTRMGAEKVEAFYESWAAMWGATWRAQQAMSRQMVQSSLRAARPVWPTQQALSRHVLDVLTDGLTPVHRHAAANAKRLGGPKRR
jgi:hypothetical protein